MITSKERAFLKRKANDLVVSVTIGQNDITESLIASIDNALDAKELIKISILQNSSVEAKSVAEEIAKILVANVVQVIGRKIVLYRKSKKKNVKHIEFNI